MDSLWLDVRTAARSLRKNPGFTAVAVVTLALGIGANATIFSLVHGVVMRPLPYPNGDRLAVIWADFGVGGQSLPAVNAKDYRDYRRMSERFEDFAAASGNNVVGLTGAITGDGPPELVDLSPVTANFFPLLGVQPILGRPFTAEEEAFEGPKAAILSFELWQRRYGGDRALVGQTIEIDGIAHRVVGILPPGFHLLLPAEAFLIKHSQIWVPLQFDYDHNTRPRNWTSFSVYGKLRPGASFEQAQADMDRIAGELRAAHPELEAARLRLRVVPFHDDVVKGARPALYALAGSVGFVLLIVCANVANLMLVRGAARGKEIAIRSALGASRGRIVRRLLIESLLLSGLGGGLALAFTAGALATLRHLPFAQLPRLGEVSIDATVWVFTAAVALGTSVLFGLVPALQGTRIDLARILGFAGRTTASRGQNRLRQALVMGEVAMSLVLLIAVGLLLRSFAAVHGVRPGFDADGVLTFRLELPAGRYGDWPARVAFYRELERRLRELPGVREVGAITQLPLSGSGPLSPYAYDEETARNWESVTADGRWITAGYFRTLGARLLEGRSFDEHEVEAGGAGERRVIVVDRTLAERVWPGESAVGRRLQVNPTGDDEPFAEVVGVVEHVRMHDLTREVRGQIYYPGGGARSLSYAVRTDGAAAALVRPIEDAVRGLDPGLPVTQVRPLADFVDDAMGSMRLSVLLMGLFGGLAVILVALGIYGVISYSVAQRTRELAIRMALGAVPARLLGTLLGRSLSWVALAAAGGVAASLAVTRFLRGLLFQVEPGDPLTLAAAVLFLGAVALAASYLPARRATRLQPSVVLRAD